MRSGGQFVMAAAARLYAPVLAAIALAVLVNSDPGAGLGIGAGLLFALALLLYALIFGAEALRRAFPVWLARVLLAAGVILAIAGGFAPADPWRGAIVEAGAFAAAVAAAHLIAIVFMGRAAALPDADW